MSLPDPPLLIVTDRRQAALPLAQIVEAVMAAGCRWVSVREKDLPARAQFSLAASLRPIAKRFGAHLTLHGALACDPSAAAMLDGIHLPDGAGDEVARGWRSAGKLVGRSIHSAAEIATVDPSVFDYVVAGPAYETASKPGYGPPLGPDGLSAFGRATTLPVVAIGGVDPENVGALMQAGVAGVAVMGSVMRAVEPSRQAGALLDALHAARGYPRPR